MFDIGFWELTLIGLVALLVIGPERLPGVARTVGFWLGKARRMTDAVKQEIREELHAEEMRQTLAESMPIEEVHALMEEGSEAVKSITEAGKAFITGDNPQQKKPTTERKPDEQ